MTPQQIKANAPDGATHYTKKPFRKVKYLRCSYGIFSEIDNDGKIVCICRDWLFWIKPHHGAFCYTI